MANNLAKYRGKHGLTQEQLGAKLGLTKAAISYAEKNKVRLSTIKKFAKVLGENYFRLMGSDILLDIPKTEEDKKALIEIIENL